MKTIEYEKIAKEITGLEGKYIGNATVKLSDGSKIQVGENVAVQIIDNGTEYSSIMYERKDKEWKSSSMSGYEKKNHENTHGELLDDVYTFSEACEKYGLESSTLRKRIEYEKKKEQPELVEGTDYRKSGSTWLITKDAMKRIYGMTFENPEDVYDYDTSLWLSDAELGFYVAVKNGSIIAIDGMQETSFQSCGYETYYISPENMGGDPDDALQYIKDLLKRLQEK